jgi:sterol desaturase/sphingolipid hydroxylase (fatty acid hydroxylase superfamily)
MVLIAALRLLHGQAWITLGRSRAEELDKRSVQPSNISLAQVDREADWDNFILLQALLASSVHFCLSRPSLSSLGFSGSWGFDLFPSFNAPGLLQLLIWHCGPAELVYYWLHRTLHQPSLFRRYHSHHHRSIVTEPVTGSVHPFAEHLLYGLNFAIPLVGTWACGGASICMLYVYLLGFDFMNNLGHINAEIVPSSLYSAFPPLRYLLYNPSFHSLHHSQFNVNYALFMPLYDYVYGTADERSVQLHTMARAGQAAPPREPKCVFLAHGTDMTSMFHLPFALRSFSSKPYQGSVLLAPLWPLAVLAFAIFRSLGRVFTADRYVLGRQSHRPGSSAEETQACREHSDHGAEVGKGGDPFSFETWVVPAVGFQYFLDREKKYINSCIKQAIQEADERGVQVVGLGALNKSEPVNAGGSIFVDGSMTPEPRARIAHGNTLTAGAILHNMPSDVHEVFLVGGTSKLGKALGLWLAERGVRVRLMTQSRERFAGIVACARFGSGSMLQHVDRLNHGSDCDQWLVGKHLSPKDQQHAPQGATFYQFAVPELKRVRSDCTYTSMPAFKLPEGTNVRSCEMTMPRQCVHACHAGALVHALEGYSFHEVGSVDHTCIDMYMEAAKRHGFKVV